MKCECPKCKSTKSWKLNDGRLRCRSCRHRFSPAKFPVRMDAATLRAIASEFVLEHSCNTILDRVGVSRFKLLKTLTLFRMAMTKDVPKVFEGTVEVDETYVGGKWKNKTLRKRRELAEIKRGRGTSKQPVFGILCRQGKVFAEVVENAEAGTLQSIILRRVRKGSTVCSDTWHGYTGIAAKGYVHRLVNHSKSEYSDKHGHHINGLEGFWGYLKRKLSAKGGIRKGRLPIYLGEYVWRYNHRQLSFREREKALLRLIKAKYLAN